MSLRVQVAPPQVHPVPAIDTNARPEGTVSLTVTVPLVGPAPAALLTTTEYALPACPCGKLPLWLLAMPNMAGGGAGPSLCAASSAATPRGPSAITVPLASRYFG